MHEKNPGAFGQQGHWLVCLTAVVRIQGQLMNDLVFAACTAHCIHTTTKLGVSAKLQNKTNFPFRTSENSLMISNPLSTKTFISYLNVFHEASVVERNVMKNFATNANICASLRTNKSTIRVQLSRLFTTSDVKEFHVQVDKSRQDVAFSSRDVKA